MARYSSQSSGGYPSPFGDPMSGPPGRAIGETNYFSDLESDEAKRDAEIFGAGLTAFGQVSAAEKAAQARERAQQAARRSAGGGAGGALGTISSVVGTVGSIGGAIAAI